MTATVAGILLAAGASRRLGEPKQLVTDADGTALVVRSAQQLLAAGCSPTVVVVGAKAPEVSAALYHLPVHICVNAKWEDGIGTSIGRGFKWLLDDFDWTGTPETVPTAAIISPCDMPSVTASHLLKLIKASDGGRLRVGSGYESKTNTSGSKATTRGVPALFPKADWTVLSQLSGNRGAKYMIDSQESLTVFLRYGNLDIDTPADLAQWRADPSSSI